MPFGTIMRSSPSAISRSQDTDMTTGVTLNAIYGSIALAAPSAAVVPGAYEEFTLTNNQITAESEVQLTQNGVPPAGIPYPLVVSVANGSAVIRIYNLDSEANMTASPGRVVFTVLR